MWMVVELGKFLASVERPKIQEPTIFLKSASLCGSQLVPVLA